MINLDAISLTLNFITIGIAIIAGVIANQQLKNADKRERFRGTADLFDRFNAPEARADRRWVYHNCRKLLNKEKLYLLQLDSNDLDHLENVCNYLDWVSMNVNNGLINLDDAISIYGDSFIRCWVVLRPWIEFTRNERKQGETLWRHIEEFSNDIFPRSCFNEWRQGVIIYTPEEIITVNYENSTIKYAKKTN